MDELRSKVRFSLPFHPQVAADHYAPDKGQIKSCLYKKTVQLVARVKHVVVDDQTLWLEQHREIMAADLCVHYVQTAPLSQLRQDHCDPVGFDQVIIRKQPAI